MKITIYALVDPRTEKVRYVGQSREVIARVMRHLRREAHDPIYKSEWLRELAEAGFAPTVKLLAEVDESDADEVERQQIAIYQSADLLNWKYPKRPKRLDSRPKTTVPFTGALAANLNLAAVAMVGRVFRGDLMMPCPVCDKLVRARGVPK